jgi:hypothetical protein
MLRVYGDDHAAERARFRFGPAISFMNASNASSVIGGARWSSQSRAPRRAALRRRALVSDDTDFPVRFSLGTSFCYHANKLVQAAPTRGRHPVSAAADYLQRTLISSTPGATSECVSVTPLARDSSTTYRTISAYPARACGVSVYG